MNCPTFLMTIYTYLLKLLNIIATIYYKIAKFIKIKKLNRDYFALNLMNNDEPANILSSDEINDMINNQIKFNKEHSNTNEYKIIKQNNKEDFPEGGKLLNVNEIRNEINQIEFEDEEEHKNNGEDKIDNDEKNGENKEKDDIEELKKVMLGSNDELLD